jgi:hypothetical protein
VIIEICVKCPGSNLIFFTDILHRIREHLIIERININRALALLIQYTVLCLPVLMD